MPNHPLAEVFGFPPDNLSAEADRHRRDRLCPFGNAVPNCTKTSIENPLGVCSVHGAGGETVITCPVRFQEGWRIASDAAGFFFPPGAAWTSLTEVRLNDSVGKSAGNRDVVLLSYDSLGRPVDYGLLRVQTVPAPSQMDIFDGKNRRIAVAMSTAAFHALPPVTEVNPADASLALFLYDLMLNQAQNRYALTLHRTVYAKQSAELTDTKVPKAALFCEIEQQLEAVRLG